MSLKHFYIFRHGETVSNNLRIFQGQSRNDYLNEKGMNQAYELAKFLADKNLELMVSSPLNRALETAQIIAKKLQIHCLRMPQLIEGNLGSVENKKPENLTDEEKQIFKVWKRLLPQYMSVSFEGGETKQQILSRAIYAIHQLAKRPETVFGVSTHSTVIRLLMLLAGRYQHKIPNAQAFHFTYENGVLRYAEDENLLLLSCCAPCSCAVIEKLALEKRRFSVVFYNPNIRPVEEYEKRRVENERVCTTYDVPFIPLEYDNLCWRTLTKGMMREPERGKRCSLCFHMRLKRVMTYAKIKRFDAVASVLGVSRYKDLNQVNAAAELASFETGCPYQLIEGRKNGMQIRREALIDKLNLYQQTYCGCRPPRGKVDA